MKKEWFTAKELAGLPGMPSTDRRVRSKAKREVWQSQKRSKGKGHEYHLTSLPQETRTALATRAVNQARVELQLPKEPAPAHDKAALMAEFNRLPHKKQQRANARFKMLCIWSGWLEKSGQQRRVGTAQFCRDYMAGKIAAPDWILPHMPHRNGVLSLSYDTLNKWRNSEEEKGIIGLVDSWGNRSGQSKINLNPKLCEIVDALIIERPHIKPGQIKDYLCAKHPELDIVSAKGIERHIKRWKKEHAQDYIYQTNPDQWKNRHLVAFGSASEDVTRLNQLWELDATPGDWMLKDGRHSLSGVIDVYARRPKFLVTKTPTSEAHCTLMRRSIIAWGKPDGVKLDNGQDYKAQRLARVCRDLDIDQYFCPPFTPEEKPHIERVFQTLSHGLLDLLPGFIGHNVAERSVIEARKSFASRIMTRGETIEVELSSAELQEKIDDWVEHYYMDQPHGGLNQKTPRQMVNDYTGTILRINSNRALDMLLAEGGTRTVGKKGIRIDNGLYIHAALAEWIGEEIEALRDPDDLGYIYVYGYPPESTTKVFICRAEDPDRTGISRKEVAAVAKNRQRKAMQAASAAHREAKKALKGEDIVTAVLEHRKEQRANVTDFQRPGETYTNATLDEAEAAADARDNPTPKTVFSAEQKAAQARLVAEMDSAATVTHIEDNKKARMRRWLELDNIMTRGDGVDGEDYTFWRGYRDTPEWKAQQILIEDFGLDYIKA